VKGRLTLEKTGQVSESQPPNIPPIPPVRIKFSRRAVFEVSDTSSYKRILYTEPRWLPWHYLLCLPSLDTLSSDWSCGALHDGRRWLSSGFLWWLWPCGWLSPTELESLSYETWRFRN